MHKKRSLRGFESLEIRMLLAADLHSADLEMGLSEQTVEHATVPDGHDDSDLIFDGTGYYYFDPVPELDIEEIQPDEGVLNRMGLNVPIFHSNPSAAKKILLDFDGQIITGTGWNNGNGGNPIHAPAYSTDSDILNFNSTELANIEQVFLRVSEDFAPFNVDVTTEDPGSSFFAQGNQGIRVMISTNVDSAALGGTGNQWFSPAGGVAYLNSWGWSSDTPVWVFENYLSNGNAKSVAEAASHEVGHSLNLGHDGGGGDGEYYGGHGSGTTGWAPIMGVGYNKNVTQWSRGEYSNPSNTQNDLNIMTVSSRIPYRVDDHSSSITSVGAATPLVPASGNSVSMNGIIERNSDIDVFSIIVSGVTIVDLDIDPVSTGPNLDIEVTLYDSSGTVLLADNSTNLLDASFSTTLVPGSYTLAVDGVGKGTPSNGYSDYGSLGQYSITGTIDVGAAACGNPFTVSGTMGDQHADLYYTPSTGVVVMDSDSTYLQYLNVEGNEPGQVDFLPDFWTYDYFNGSAQWFLSPGIPAFEGAARLATYDAGLDPPADFTCVEYGYTLIDDVNAQSFIGFANVAFDEEGPSAAASLGDITTGGGTDYQFTVTYADNVAVNYDTISDSDVRVTSSNGYAEFAQLVSATANSDGSVDATYSVPANGGAWDGTDNGTYFVNTVINQVADLGGNNLSGAMSIDSFTVDVDLTCGTPFANSGVMGDQHADFYYTPSTGIVVMDTDDLFMQYMKVEGAEPTQVDFQPQFWNYAYFNGAAQWFIPPGLPAFGGAARLATYADSLNPPAAFPCLEFGYTLLDDVNAQSFIGFGDVAIDAQGPSGVTNPNDVTVGGGLNYQFTVTHSDNVAVDLDTVSNGDVTVTGPGGFSEVAQLVSATQNADGSIDAVYAISANGGSWDASDNGTYVVETVTGEVTDLGGNAELGGVTIGSFDVAIVGGTPNDLDGDGDVDADDIDTLCLAIASGSTDTFFDIDGNGIIDSTDFDSYLVTLGTLPGDANLDGVVDVSDFSIWNANKFTSNDPADHDVGWATGDFNCDGVTDVSDFSTWNANKFTSALLILTDANDDFETRTLEVEYGGLDQQLPVVDLAVPQVKITAQQFSGRVSHRGAQRQPPAPAEKLIDRVFESAWL